MEIAVPLIGLIIGGCFSWLLWQLFDTIRQLIEAVDKYYSKRCDYLESRIETLEAMHGDLDDCGEEVES